MLIDCCARSAVNGFWEQIEPDLNCCNPLNAKALLRCLLPESVDSDFATGIMNRGYTTTNENRLSCQASCLVITYFLLEITQHSQ